MYWRCNKRDYSSFLFTNEAYDYFSETEHNHSFDMKKFNNTLFTKKLKEKTVMNDEKTKDLIINAYCREFTNLPFNYANVRRKIVEFRNKANFKYENDYDISQKICFTKNDEQFLYFDSRKDNVNRVIVFTTKQNMNHLGMNKIWVCDGTFKTAPKEFEQLFTI
ncbi:hypothetical protein CDIK_2460 [Cucumispora dikerogammari]|nr:hypothetical protein CDIK_2460 [Cucumispora dikerogammari]